jgi:hypothetical protein
VLPQHEIRDRSDDAMARMVARAGRYRDREHAGDKTNWSPHARASSAHVRHTHGAMNGMVV